MDLWEFQSNLVYIQTNPVSKKNQIKPHAWEPSYLLPVYTRSPVSGFCYKEVVFIEYNEKKNLDIFQRNNKL